MLRVSVNTMRKYREGGGVLGQQKPLMYRMTGRSSLQSVVYFRHGLEERLRSLPARQAVQNSGTASGGQSRDLSYRRTANARL